MREFMAMTTPQQVINQCVGAIAVTIQQKTRVFGEAVKLDHFAFVIDPAVYSFWRVEFDKSLAGTALELPLADGGIAAAGLQSSSLHLSWFYGGRIPALALVPAAPARGFAAGGGYVVGLVNDLNDATGFLARLGIDCEQTELYGRKALRVPLTSADWDVSAGYYGLYFTTEGLLDAARRLA